ncbi:hypothetical protein AB0J86_32285 [Micromonospora sp. NPDC049559]|uniref:hypothetical protein n=1 Tax=Micromonospora sp. NPDC049559 TaxID=3155923 RepID=UPI00343D6AC1
MKRTGRATALALTVAAGVLALGAPAAAATTTAAEAPRERVSVSAPATAEGFWALSPFFSDYGTCEVYRIVASFDYETDGCYFDRGAGGWYFWYLIP